MVKIESKAINNHYDVDVKEDNSSLSELVSIIAVSIKHTMNKHNMTYDDVMDQVEMFVRNTKLGVVVNGNERSK